MRTEFLCISVLRVGSGPRVKLASCKSALHAPPRPQHPPPPGGLLYWPFWGGGPGVGLTYSLLLCGLFYEPICCMSFRVSFCSCVFQSF